LGGSQIESKLRGVKKSFMSFFLTWQENPADFQVPVVLMSFFFLRNQFYYFITASFSSYNFGIDCTTFHDNYGISTHQNTTNIPLNHWDLFCVHFFSNQVFFLCITGIFKKSLEICFCTDPYLFHHYPKFFWLCESISQNAVNSGSSGVLF
jgi:hypothetical protein